MPTDFYENTILPQGFSKEIVEKAFKYATKAHSGQLRKSGDPYVSHPIAVSKILLSIAPESSMVAAALLHDVIEDTKYKYEDIKKEFGKEIADLVLGVTNLGEIDFSTYSTEEEAEEAKIALKNESLRHLFLSMSKDVRVVIIKLADRLHNMRTIKSLAKNNQTRISRETLNIFAPLALRLGIGEIRGELEDLAFPIAYPDEYKYLKNEANRRYKAADRYTLKLIRTISDKLETENINGKIEGRAKHIYSLYKKITRPEINWDFDKIYDLIALRIITRSIEDCYKILGTIHSLYRPLPNYIRDYIAAPKPNGYRSIHTSVFGPEGRIFEIQIRTEEMHEEAEYGVASHLHYSMEKSSGKTDKDLEKGTFAKSSQTDFLKRIKEWQKQVGSTDEFIEGLKIEFLDDRIYVFSPRGDIYDLPVGATPVDFAYEVHSKVGDTCRGAKVNGKIVPLSYKLSTRDVVEIISGKEPSPNRAWLDFIKTSKAKQHIRSFFRKFEFSKNHAEGKKIVEEELSLLNLKISDITEHNLKSALSDTSFKNIESVFASVGEGLTTPRQALKIILGRSYIPEEDKKTTKITPENQENIPKGMKIQLAPCCNPKKSDRVICYITRGRGFTVHKRSCKNIKSLEKDRILEYNPWKKTIFSEIEIRAANRIGLLFDISQIVSRLEINIDTIKNRHIKEGSQSKINISVQVDDVSELAELIEAINDIKDVFKVKIVK